MVPVPVYIVYGSTCTFGGFFFTWTRSSVSDTRIRHWYCEIESGIRFQIQEPIACGSYAYLDPMRIWIRNTN
jgi:hypothetical protein